VDDLAEGASCTLEVKRQGASSSTTLALAEGTNPLKFSNITPGATVGLFRLSCSGGNAKIDWLTVANGPYVMSPLVDIEATANPTKVPSGGRMTFVRPSDDGNYLLMGSDVGGLSYSTDGEYWQFANGKSQDFIDRGDMGTWDAWYPEGPATAQTVVATGDNTDGGGGGLWTGWAGGDDWTEILVDEDLGFTKHASGCLDEDHQPVQHDLFSSGKILVHDPADEWDSVYALAQRRETDGTDADGMPIIVLDTHGVYRVTGTSSVSTPAICEPYAVGGTSLPEDALPTAAAIVSDEYGEQSWLLVGYTVRNYASDAGRGGLYLCPLVSDTGVCDGTLECIELDDGDALDEELLDVRDIEVNPMVPNQVFIVDGGKRAADVDWHTCTHQHSTVYAMTVTTDSGGDPVVEIWDTDATDTTNRPSWSVVPPYADGYFDGTVTYSTGDPLPYYYSTAGALKAPLRGCPSADDPSRWVGDLVAPNDAEESAESIVSVVADPGSNFLLAFYQVGDGIPGLSCVRHFRAHLDGADPVAEGNILDWHPLLDYGDRDDNFLVWYGDIDPSLVGGSIDRYAHIDAAGSYLDAEPVVWAHTGAMHDAVFWDDGSASYAYRLQLAAQYPWWIPQTGDAIEIDGTAVVATGWDAEDGSDDLDEVAFLMGELGARTFQDGTFFDIATLSAATADGPVVADLTYAAAGDISLFTLHGDEDPASREAADRACQLAGLTIAGGSVDAWTGGERDASDDLVHEAWYAPVTVTAGDYHDAAQKNALLHRRSSGEWCWDAVAVSGRTNYIAYDADEDFRWELSCLDSGKFLSAYGKWPQCNASQDEAEANVFGLGAVGRITDVVALGENTALVASAGRCGGSANSSDICAEGSGEGLWVVYDDGATGLRYEEVAYDETVPSVPVAAGLDTCAKVDFFEGVWDEGDPSDPADDAVARGAATLSLHPDTDTTTGGTHVRVFVSTKSCGVREVEFELGYESTPLGWTAWPHDACPVSGPPEPPIAAYDAAEFLPGLTFGATVTPDGAHLLVYGGAAGGSTANGGGVCEIDLADGAARTAVPADGIRQAITAVVPHPDVEGLFVATSYREGEDATAGPSGVYLIQRRALPWSAFGPAFAWRRVSGDDLDHARGMAASWGTGRGLLYVSPGDPAPTHDHLYLATVGGGPWDLDLSW